MKATENSIDAAIRLWKNSNFLSEVHFSLNGLLFLLVAEYVKKKKKKVRKSKKRNNRAKEEPLTVIHRKMSNKLLFTEKYDTKFALAPFEEYSPSITTATPGK